MPGLTKIGELVCLELPAQPAFVGVARSVVAAVASTLDGIDDDRLEDLRVAVSEACTNAVETHRRDAVDDRVVVRCTATAEHLAVRIEDRGDGFSPANVPSPPEPESLPSSAERGWGLQLIEALVDEVTFGQTVTGTTVDLVIRFEPVQD